MIILVIAALVLAGGTTFLVLAGPMGGNRARYYRWSRIGLAACLIAGVVALLTAVAKSL